MWLSSRHTFQYGTLVELIQFIRRSATRSSLLASPVLTLTASVHGAANYSKCGNVRGLKFRGWEFAVLDSDSKASPLLGILFDL